jgi:hypothetical protein
MQSQYNNFDMNFYSNKFQYYAHINEHVRNFHIKMELLEDLQVQSFVVWTYLANYFGSEPLLWSKDKLYSLQ